MVIFKISWGNNINMGAYSKVSSQNLTADVVNIPNVEFTKKNQIQNC